MNVDWKFQRRRSRLMNLLRERGIEDERVLVAMNQVPRHLFVDEALRARAYHDEALPIGMKQTISQPFTVAYQTMMLAPQPGERILEIGTGSGYQAAILCEMGARVFTIERLRPLYERTLQLLRDLGYKALCRCGDGTQGWEAVGPFDGIIVTAGATLVPDKLLQQVRIPGEGQSGGRLVIPVGDRDSQRMTRISRESAVSYVREETEGFRFVPLIGAS
ncbi:MAG: protein-L-isoaspartate(D-aspartate) O-methyltransferase [Rhodothermia bacterium]|nr:MAG: protein-L-isoaspartate(D-aspartate) O-methyltransferase [Rhodothermia bacterium]